MPPCVHNASMRDDWNTKNVYENDSGKIWSEQQDSNLRPPDPETGALPDCAMLRRFRHTRTGTELEDCKTWRQFKTLANDPDIILFKMRASAAPSSVSVARLIAAKRLACKGRCRVSGLTGGDKVSLRRRIRADDRVRTPHTACLVVSRCNMRIRPLSCLIPTAISATKAYDRNAEPNRLLRDRPRRTRYAAA